VSVLDTQHKVEAVASGTAATRTTQLTPEAVATGTAATRATQLQPEAVVNTTGATRTSQINVEGVVQAGFARCTQFLLSVLSESVDTSTPVTCFDLGAEYEHPVTSHRRAVKTTAEQGFVMRRQVWERERRRFLLQWKNAMEGDVYALRVLWDLLFGGAVDLCYSPQDGSGEIRVCAVPGSFVVERYSGVASRMSIELQEVP
jgi:hypothetical protein